MRFAARTDIHHAEIRDGLRKCGVYVMDLSKAGRGCPDLLCFTPRTGWIPLEVKTKRTGKRLTKGQAIVHARVPILVIDSLDQGLAIFGISPSQSQAKVSLAVDTFRKRVRGYLEDHAERRVRPARKREC